MGQLSMYTICHTWSVWQFGIYFSSRFFQFLTSLGSSFGIGVRQVTPEFSGRDVFTLQVGTWFVSILLVDCFLIVLHRLGNKDPRTAHRPAVRHPFW